MNVLSIPDVPSLASPVTDRRRIENINRPIWIDYPRIKGMTDRAMDIIFMPPKDRAPFYFVIGDSNSGKTTFLHRLESVLPGEILNRSMERYGGNGGLESVGNNLSLDPIPTSDRTTTPSVFAKIPPKPTFKNVMRTIMNAANAPYIKSDGDEDLRQKIIKFFKALKVRVLFIDEMHHINVSAALDQRVILNALKTIADDSRITVVAAGIDETVSLISIDEQIAQRHQREKMPRIEDGAEFLGVLVAFEQFLDLRKPSNLADNNTPLPQKILELSEGLIGELHRLLALAATKAIRSGRERITMNLLESLDEWMPPSQRSVW